MTYEVCKVFDKNNPQTRAKDRLIVRCGSCGSILGTYETKEMIEHLVNFQRSQIENAMCGRCQDKARDNLKKLTTEKEAKDVKSNT